VEVEKVGGGMVTITDPTELEDIRKALRETFPYFRDHESWRKDYELRLYRTGGEPDRVLRAQLGNRANTRAFWFQSPEGEYQNIALYDVLSKQDSTNALLQGSQSAD
jgi:hypothetical protein